MKTTILTSAFFGVLLSFTCNSTLAQQSVAPSGDLVFTEYSDTLLTAKLNGTDFGTVVNTAPNGWTWRYTVSGRSFNSLAVDGPSAWKEPVGESGYNLLSSVAAMGGPGLDLLCEMEFVSDIDVVLPPVVENGAFGPTVLITEAGAPVLGPLRISFLDLGDTSSVPDAASTVALLVGAMTLLGLIRRRS